MSRRRCRGTTASATSCTTAATSLPEPDRHRHHRTPQWRIQPRKRRRRAGPPRFERACCPPFLKSLRARRAPFGLRTAAHES
jgi:hypothetical protein